MAKILDIVVFGATGYTGKLLIPALLQFTKGKNLAWGIAGRSESKLKDVLNTYEQRTGCSLGKVPIIIADVEDEKSLENMARKARIVINCCGPYHLYGEQVVRSCIEQGTHHLDLSAEFQYIETLPLKYQKRAEEKGVYIISACGWESVVADLGVVYMQQKFQGTLNSVESHLTLEVAGNIPGPAFNIATYESAIQISAHPGKLMSVHRKLFPYPLPDFQPKLKVKLLPHKHKDIGWTVFMYSPDYTSVQRTQRYLYERESKRPVQVATYLLGIGTFRSLLLLAIGALTMLLFSQFSFGRRLLLKYPEKFSFGFFSGKPPSEEKRKNIGFTTTLLGKGWDEKLPDANHEYTTPPNKTISLSVKGRDPGYAGTATIIALSAIAILTERKKMPPTGGVYTPGYAFANTSLFEEINKHDFSFKMSVR